VYFFFIKLLIQFTFFYGHNFFHLDNPVTDPVEEKTISNPNPKNSQYPPGLDSKIRILYTRGSQIFGVMEPMTRLTMIYGAPQ